MWMVSGISREEKIYGLETAWYLHPHMADHENITQQGAMSAAYYRGSQEHTDFWESPLASACCCAEQTCVSLVERSTSLHSSPDTPLAYLCGSQQPCGTRPRSPSLAPGGPGMQCCPPSHVSHVPALFHHRSGCHHVSFMPVPYVFTGCCRVPRMAGVRTPPCPPTE